MIQIWENDVLKAIYADKKDAAAYVQADENSENIKIVEVKD